MCERRVEQVENELDFIRSQFGDVDAVEGLFNRGQEFVNLTLFGRWCVGRCLQYTGCQFNVLFVHVQLLSALSSTSS